MHNVVYRGVVQA